MRNGSKICDDTDSTPTSNQFTLKLSSAVTEVDARVITPNKFLAFAADLDNPKINSLGTKKCYHTNDLTCQSCH